MQVTDRLASKAVIHALETGAEVEQCMNIRTQVIHHRWGEACCHILEEFREALLKILSEQPNVVSNDMRAL